MATRQPFDSKEFYSRQVALSELGANGQKRLNHSKVVVVGLGGLGSASSLYLALAGVGYLRLVDQDTVEMNNLHRQVLYDLGDLMYPKVEAAAKRVQQINPDVKVESVPENVRESNVEEIVKGMDCVVDGLDNMRTRYLLNRACVKHKIPYVFGGAIGIEGNLSVFHSPKTPCLECILPNIDDRYMPTCEVRGVLGATTGIIGTMQAMETIKLLSGIGEPLEGKLMVCDFRDMYFAVIDIFKKPDCPVCQGEIKPIEGKERLVWLCGRNTVNVNPQKPISMNLNKVYESLRRHFQIIIKSSLVIVFKYNRDIEVSLFNHGRMLIKNVEDEKYALKVYNNVLAKLGFKTPIN
jgi:molybdopterin/thiamine biosynthesis adenylyltransferase